MASKSRASTQELAECSQSIASSHWTSPLCHIGPVNLKSKLELRIYDELRSLVPRFLMQRRFSGWGNPESHSSHNKTDFSQAQAQASCHSTLYICRWTRKHVPCCIGCAASASKLWAVLLGSRWGVWLFGSSSATAIICVDWRFWHALCNSCRHGSGFNVKGAHCPSRKGSEINARGLVFIAWAT